MNRYKLEYLLLIISSIALIMAYAFSYDIFQALNIGKTTFMLGMINILCVALFAGMFICIRESKHNKLIYIQKKQDKIDSIRELLKENNVQDDDIKERIEFLEGQNLSKIKEVEKKLQEKIEKNRKDQINEYNFFNPIENIN